MEEKTVSGLVRITLVGPESTGKTTLARELAAQFGVPWVPEAARAYVEERKGELTYADVIPIAQRHVRDADAIAKSGVVILDTDLVMTCMYSRFYYGDCPPEVLAWARARLADLYLLLDTDVPWIADGVRDMPHRREEIHGRIVAQLAELGAPQVVRIGGDWAARRTQAVAAIAATLKS